MSLSPLGGWGSCIAALVAVWLGLNALAVVVLSAVWWVDEKRRKSEPVAELVEAPAESDPVPVKRTWVSEMGLRRPR